MSAETTVTTATTTSKDDLFTTEEVAKVVGVTVRTLQYWNKRRIFEPYLIDHKGNFFYTREELEQLQSVYHKDWHRPHKRQKQARTSCGHSESDVADVSSGQNVKSDFADVSSGQNVNDEYFSKSQKGEKNAVYKKISDLTLDAINRIAPEDLERLGVVTRANDGKTFVCVICKNGTHKPKSVGVKPNFVNGAWLWNCKSCEKCFNNFQILAIHYGLDTRADYVSLVERICNDFAISIQYEDNPNFKAEKNETSHADEKPATDSELAKLIRSDIADACAKISALPATEKRGLNADTFQTFQIGVDFKWTPPKNRLKNEKLYDSPRVIIPHLTISALPEIPLSYCAALFQSERKRLESQGKDYLKYLYGGDRTPFGLNTLNADADLILATEGEFDALSIWQATGGKYPCLATGGTALNQISDSLTKFFNHHKPKILFFADNDDAGLKFAKTFCKVFIRCGFCAVFKTFAPLDADKLDANKILMNSGDNKLDKMIQDRIELAQVDFDKAADAVNRHKEFLKKIDFIKHSHEDFIKLYDSPQTPQRDKAMAQIILNNLDWKTKQGKRLYPLPTAINFRRIFNCDPVLSELFGYEEFKGETVLLRQPFWDKNDRVNSEWTDADDAQLRVYLRDNYADLSSKFTTDDIFSVIAKENAFNVVKQYLENLPAWDGRKRAEKLFIDFLGVADSEFARAVTFKWLLAAVARIYRPGCNFQAALVLQGQQNIGKSYIFEKLGGKWYGTLSDNVDDTHAIDAIRNLWICEMKEFSAARKTEINAVKSFIERSADNYRAAYQRRAQNFRRHCVFGVSVNDKQFLRDQTGNRRYWILESPLSEFGYIDSVNDEKLDDEYIKQVWAEVLQKFKELTKDGFDEKILELPKGIKIQAESIAEEFTYNDGLEKEIEAFLDAPILPPVLWQVLTKHEKRNFFKTGYIELDPDDWDTRKNLLKSKVEKTAFDNARDDAKFVREIEIPRGKNTHSGLIIRAYGSYQRQETCAVEILNEFLNDDKRKMSRVHEVLNKLAIAGKWRRTKNQDKNFHGNGKEKNDYGYGNQKNFYSRVQSSDTADDDDNDSSQTADDDDNDSSKTDNDNNDTSDFAQGSNYAPITAEVPF